MTTLASAPPPLEDGWQPTTPQGDTLVRRYVDNHVALLHAVAKASQARTERTPSWAAADLGRPATIFNAAVLTHPSALSEMARTVRELDAFFARGSGSVYLWSPWPTPDLHRSGWQLEGHPPLLVRPPGGPVPATRDIEVARVSDATAVGEWERIVVDGYPFPDCQGSTTRFLHPRVLDDPRLRLWLAFEGGRPVTASGLFDAYGVSHFMFGVTLPQVRRRGHWYAAVRERLLASPSTPAVGVFSDDSRLGAERAGFLPISRFTLWSRTR